MSELKYIKKKVKINDPEAFEKSMNTVSQVKSLLVDKEEYDFRIKRLKSIDYIQIYDIPSEENRLATTADFYNFDSEYLFTVIDINSEPYKTYLEILDN